MLIKYGPNDELEEEVSLEELEAAEEVYNRLNSMERK